VLERPTITTELDFRVAMPHQTDRQPHFWRSEFYIMEQATDGSESYFEVYVCFLFFLRFVMTILVR
jgi:hypothetical protein